MADEVVLLTPCLIHDNEPEGILIRQQASLQNKQPSEQYIMTICHNAMINIHPEIGPHESQFSYPTCMVSHILFGQSLRSYNKKTAKPFKNTVPNTQNL